MKKLIAILHGDIPADAPLDEQDTLDQCERVERSLHELGYRTERVELSLDIKKAVEKLKKLKPACVFNLVDSVNSQSALCYMGPLACEIAGLPHTSAGSRAIYLTTSKPLAKKMFRLFGLPTAVEIPDLLNAKKLPQKGMYIVKSATEDGGVGMDAKCCGRDLKYLQKVAREKTAQYGGEWFAEKYIEGREFNVAIVPVKGKPTFMPIAEIQFKNFKRGQPKIVDYAAKWLEDSEEYINTPQNFEFTKKEQPMLERIRKLTLECYHKFEINGVVRADIRVDNKGRPWLLELNINPCLNQGSGLVVAAKQMGYSHKDLIQMILNEALRRARR